MSQALEKLNEKAALLPIVVHTLLALVARLARCDPMDRGFIDTLKIQMGMDAELSDALERLGFPTPESALEICLAGVDQNGEMEFDARMEAIRITTEVARGCNVLITACFCPESWKEMGIDFPTEVDPPARINMERPFPRRDTRTR